MPELFMGYNICSEIMIDDYQNVWIGTSSTGLLKFNGVNWTVYDQATSGLPHNDVSSVAVDTSGIIWVGTQGGGLARLDTNENWEVFTMANSGLPADEVFAIAIDNDNNKWISTHKHPIGGGQTALAVFDEVTWVVYTEEETGFPAFFTDIFIDNSNVTWLSMNTIGLSKFDGTDWTLYNSSNSSLPDNGIRSVSSDQEDNKWIVAGISGLVKYDGMDFNTFNDTNSGLIYSGVADLAIDNNGAKWIVGPNGLSKYQ